MGSEAPTLLAVPNVSEGRESGAITRIAAAFGSAARVLDTHTDPVHARAVFTLAAAPGSLGRALLAGARAALELLDVRLHAGAHPRIGALDVCPVVFPSVEARPLARDLALETADALGALGVPVFLYGELARSPERRERHHFRRGGLGGLEGRMRSGELVPDFGPSLPHPSGGATLVTARPPLAAFNVELSGVALEEARRIAAGLRESGGGPRGVRALAIDLGAGTVQISTNVHDPLAVPLGEIVGRVRAAAAAAGGRARAAELVGLVPAEALRGYPEEVPIRGFDPARHTIEARVHPGGDGSPERAPG